jgi:hypothetical protein
MVQQRLAPLQAKKQAAEAAEDVDLDMVALEAESDAVRQQLQHLATWLVGLITGSGDVPVKHSRQTLEQQHHERTAIIQAGVSCCLPIALRIVCCACSDIDSCS